MLLLDNYLKRENLMGPGCLLGYRSMWYRLVHKYNLSVRGYVYNAVFEC